MSSLLVIGSWFLLIFVAGRGYLPLYVGRLVFSSADRTIVLLGAATLLIAASLVLISRLLRLRSILASRVLVPGRISRHVITPFEFRIEYVFNYEDRSVRGLMAIRRCRSIEQRRDLQPGRTVTVQIQPHLARRSLIREVYSQ